MKKFISIIVLSIAVLSVFFLVLSNRYVSKTETPYFVTNENSKIIKYVVDQHPDVIKIKQLANDYSKTIANIDYRTVKGDEEFSYFSQNEIKRCMYSNYQKSFADYYKKNEIVSKLQGLDVLNIEFNKNFSTASVKTVLKTQYINATDNYLSTNKLQKNSISQCNLNINFIKQNGEWKIENIAKSNVQVTK